MRNICYHGGLYRFPVPAPVDDEEADPEDYIDPSPVHHGRPMGTLLRPLALRKCKRCGFELCEEFFYDGFPTCKLCLDEIDHPRVPRKASAA